MLQQDIDYQENETLPSFALQVKDWELNALLLLATEFKNSTIVC